MTDKLDERKLNLYYLCIVSKTDPSKVQFRNTSKIEVVHSSGFTRAPAIQLVFFVVGFFLQIL
ncbi:MAG: hypothetical protein K2X81_24365, partial [Candidatus Obscuribacterales bacterium]|nr:hypothetical protein [Candidatus Obscuribacterales bacterium]